MVSFEVWRLLALASLVALVGVVADQSENNDVNTAIDDFDGEGDVMIDLERVNNALREMTDEQLAEALFGVSPTRAKRTVNTVRDCVGFVRCLFGNYMNLDLSALTKRSKRNLGPGAVLKIISKFASVAGNAADEVLGKRALTSGASSQLTDTSSSTKDSETSEGMQNCARKQCVFSSTVYRRLRNLLRRLQ